jgi:hypothetical protein
MESQAVEASPLTSAPAAPIPSLWERVIAVYTRPALAWAGLETRAQWWFPMTLLLVVAAGTAVLLHERALMPMLLEQWDQAVADGRMTAQQVEGIEQFMAGPAGMAMTVIQQVVVWPVLMLLTALAVWFGVGFVLGTKFRYRLALEAVAWSSLITIPAQLLAAGLMWSRQTMQGIHTGFGILLPESDPPSKLMTGLGIFLDAIGPLSIWYVIVLVLGAAALSGANRKSTAWVVGGLYVLLVAFFAVLGGMMSGGGRG